MSQYIHHAIVSIDRVMELIKKSPSGTKAKLHGYTVGVTSLRLRTFYRAHTHGKMYCLGCKVEATHFSVDSFKKSSTFQQTYHLNLYAESKGGNVLMTHDHRIARSLGGSDDLSNTAMMCSPCNSKKSNSEGHLVNERRFIDTHIKDPKNKAIAEAAWETKLAEYKSRWAHLTT